MSDIKKMETEAELLHWLSRTLLDSTPKALVGEAYFQIFEQLISEMASFGRFYYSDEWLRVSSERFHEHQATRICGKRMPLFVSFLIEEAVGENRQKQESISRADAIFALIGMLGFRDKYFYYESIGDSVNLISTKKLEKKYRIRVHMELVSDVNGSPGKTKRAKAETNSPQDLLAWLWSFSRRPSVKLKLDGELKASMWGLERRIMKLNGPHSRNISGNFPNPTFGTWNEGDEKMLESTLEADNYDDSSDLEPGFDPVPELEANAFLVKNLIDMLDLEGSHLRYECVGDTEWVVSTRRFVQDFELEVRAGFGPQERVS